MADRCRVPEVCWTERRSSSHRTTGPEGPEIVEPAHQDLQEGCGEDWAAEEGRWALLSNAYGRALLIAMQHLV